MKPGEPIAVKIFEGFCLAVFAALEFAAIGILLKALEWI